MVCYYTILKTNELFHQDEFIQMVIDWLENTRNKMEGLCFQGKLPFEYEVQQKRLIIKEFHNNNLLSIYFSTKDNYKHTHFIVEIFYDKNTQELHLRFSKEMTNDSQYISSISIPTIFRTIIKSQFVKKDYFALSDRAYKVNDFQDIKEIHFQFPIVIMKTRIIDAHKLARELVGIAHVFYNVHQKEENTIQIIYPHDYVEYKVSHKKFDKIQIYEIADQIRQYHIQQHKKKMLSYEALYNQQLQEEQENLIRHTKEFQIAFEDEINRQQKEINELKELYRMLSLEYHALQRENDILQQKKARYSDCSLLSIDDYDKVNKYQSYLLELIKKSDDNLAKTQIYRKSDILQAILKANGGSQ